MKKTIVLSLLLISAFANNTWAQIDQFNLSDYKLPDLKRHALNFDFDLGGYNDYAKNPSNTPLSYDKVSNNQYSGNISINYNSYFNNVKRQSENYLSLYLNGDYYQIKLDGEKYQKMKRTSPQIYYQSTNRFYYQPLKFIELSPTINFRYAYENYVNFDSDYNNENKNHNLKATIPVKWGTGRIEQVQDARHAIYLYDELNKQNRIRLPENNDGIFELAKHISILKNERFFDSRIRKIYELEAVDSFLLANNYVLERDARYFTTLADFWDYGNTPVRNSGTRFSVAMYPGYYNYFLKDFISFPLEEEVTFNLRVFNMDMGFEFNYEKSLNLKWQNSIDLMGYYGLLYGKLREVFNTDYEKIHVPNVQFYFFHTLGYYPNTRTTVSIRNGLQYLQLFDKTDVEKEINGYDCKKFKESVALSVDYYISPKLRLGANVSLDYIWQENNSLIATHFNSINSNSIIIDRFSYSGDDIYLQHGFSSQFNVSLTYAIF
jgi:hypothetical protein